MILKLKKKKLKLKMIIKIINIKVDDIHQKKYNKNIKDNTNNNDNIDNNKYNNNKIKTNSKILDDHDIIGINKLKNDNKKIVNDLLKIENNKNAINNAQNLNLKIEKNKKDIDNDINNNNNNNNIKNNIIIKNNNKSANNNENISKKNNNENSNNDYDDDINVNLNVNEILNNKKEKNSQKEENNPNLILRSNKIKNEPERKYKRIRYQRSYSSFNFLEEPNNSLLFKTINIFNSFLIMLNNISNINEFLSKSQIIKEIDNLNKNDRFNLITIFFNLNKSFWNLSSEMNISLSDLMKKYENFIELFLQKYCKKVISSQFLNDINNMENIIFNIYNQLNDEFTRVNKKYKDTHYYNNNYNSNSNPLSNYVNNFFRENNSIISRDFTGFIEKSIYCENCRNKYYRLNMNYYNKIDYHHFFYINFDINEINNFIKNNNQKITLDFCFNYTLQKSKFYYYNCSQCHFNGKKEITSILSAPNILTIILSKNENSNFALQEELDLKKYSKSNPGDGIYLLMSVLCRLNYNGKFISYCINPNNSSWYSYTDGKIKRVNKMDINAIPLILIYQIRGTIKFIYQSLNWEKDKIKIAVKFNIAGFQGKDLFFSKNALIKDVIEQVISIFDLEKYKEENDIKLLVNGGKANNDELLVNALEGNNNVLILIRKK